MAWVMSPNLAPQRRPVEFFGAIAQQTMPSTYSAFTFADVTTWSGSSNGNAAFNFGIPCTKFRAAVLLKNFLTGAPTSSANPIVTLEVSDSAGMTANRTIVDTKSIVNVDAQIGVATSQMHQLVLEGQLWNTTKQFGAVYYRVNTANSNFGSIGAVTFDGWVDAGP